MPPAAKDPMAKPARSHSVAEAAPTVLANATKKRGPPVAPCPAALKHRIRLFAMLCVVASYQR